MKKQLTKQEIKEKQEKKQRILSLIKKALNIVCYVLSVLFLILCVAVGVQSCSKQKNSPNTNKINKQQLRSFNNDTIYNFKSYYDTGEGNLVVSTQKQIARFFDNTFNLDTPQDAISSPTLRYHNDLRAYSLYAYDLGNNEFLQVVNMDFLFDVYLATSSSYDWYYRISSIKFVFDNGVSCNYATKIQEYASNSRYNYYDINNDILLDFQTSVSYVDNELFNIFYYYVGDTTTFTFNSKINYNAPYFKNINNSYISGGYSTDQTITFDYGYFSSGGKVYNQILLQFDTASSMYFHIDSNYKLGPSGSISYMFMFYVNTLNNTRTLVNYRDMQEFNPSSSSYAYYLLNSSTWVSNNYRYLTFYNNLDDNQVTNLSKFNNLSENYTSANQYTNIGLGNVFDLLSMAFGGLISLFTIQIIPGLTIGILMFLPLVVTIIILVFKAVKK